MPVPEATCPNCGAKFRAGRQACPECGSDEHTGWKSSEEIDYSSVEIPEGWGEEPRTRRRTPVILVVAAVLALVAMALFVLR